MGGGCGGKLAGDLQWPSFQELPVATQGSGFRVWGGCQLSPFGRLETATISESRIVAPNPNMSANSTMPTIATTAGESAILWWKGSHRGKTF